MPDELNFKLHLKDYDELRRDHDAFKKKLEGWMDWGLKIVLGAIAVAILGLVISQK